nr:hypothetical protein [Staphylococcus succinus]
MIVAAVGIPAGAFNLIMFIFNIYANFESNSSFSFRVSIIGSSMTLLSILILIVIVCAGFSFILKLIKKKGIKAADS